MSSRAFDIDFAMPSWLLDKKNQLYLLFACFVALILFPIVAIARADSTKGDDDDYVNECDRYEYRWLKKEAEKAEKKRKRQEEEEAYKNDPNIQAQL
jgi:hypothetical protein